MPSLSVRRYAEELGIGAYEVHAQVQGHPLINCTSV